MAGRWLWRAEGQRLCPRRARSPTLAERGPKSENAAEVSRRRSLKTKGPAAFATGPAIEDGGWSDDLPFRAPETARPGVETRRGSKACLGHAPGTRDAAEGFTNSHGSSLMACALPFRPAQPGQIRPRHESSVSYSTWQSCSKFMSSRNWISTSHRATAAKASVPMPPMTGPSPPLAWLHSHSTRSSNAS